MYNMDDLMIWKCSPMTFRTPSWMTMTSRTSDLTGCKGNRINPGTGGS